MRLGSFLLLAPALLAQSFTQRGFLDTSIVLYPQPGANDSGHVVGEALFRYEATKTLLPNLRINGAFDARTDTHRQTQREWELTWSDRTLQRPAFSIRRLSLLYNKGKLTVEAGKQFVRWGRTDILNPTDRFAPRDFLSVIQNDFLPITAARATYESGSNTVDVVWQPRFTPSRTPLLNQRWTVLPPQLAGVRINDQGGLYPGGSEYGIRVNHVGRAYEGALSFYNGFNHLPLLNGSFDPQGFGVNVQRYYPQLRLYGGDVAVPLKWVTVKGEAGYFTSTNRTSDEYVLYVIQLERQMGEWVFVGGYAGEAVTEQRNTLGFSPERGLTRAFLGRAQYTIDANRSVAAETAVRQNGEGLYVKLEYSQAFGQHWRGTAGFAVIRGDPQDFLGQYRRNSHAILGLRYSF